MQAYRHLASVGLLVSAMKNFEEDKMSAVFILLLMMLMMLQYFVDLCLKLCQQVSITMKDK